MTQQAGKPWPIEMDPTPDPKLLTEHLLGLRHLHGQFSRTLLRRRKAVVFGGLMDSIGAAKVRMLLEFGCALVAIHAERQAFAAETQDHMLSLGFSRDQCPIYVGDLSTEEGALDLCRRIERTFGSFDIFDYVSGISGNLPFGGMSAEQREKLRAMNQVNIGSLQIAVDYFLPMFRRNRRTDIFGYSSVNAIQTFGSGQFAAYAGTKAAVEQFLHGIAVGELQNGIRTHVIAPGCIDVRRHREPGVFEATRVWHKILPRGLGKPSDIAGASLALLTDAFKYQLRQLHVIDCGLTTICFPEQPHVGIYHLL